MARICLITPHHVSFQPRTLREADSLAAAGHDVRVVCRQADQTLTSYDQDLMQSRAWRLQAIDVRRHGPNHRLWLAEGMRAKIYSWLLNARVTTDRIAIRSYVRAFDRLLALALSEAADWFIAHTQAALPIAATAARHWNAKLGFDCEDLLAEDGTDSAAVVSLIQQRYVPLCDYVSVPSKCVGERLAEVYAMSPPLVLYNVSPLQLAEGVTPPEQRAVNPTLRLHWFGQTIGAGRGVEEAVEALALMGDNQVELHLRGRLAPEFQARIKALARKRGVTDRLTFHPLVPPQELIRTMDHFDVGLALERPDHGNYSLAATNKLFSYLLAGLAVAATDTTGHRELLGQIPAAGFLYPAGQPECLAEALRGWCVDGSALQAAQQAAWDAAREKFCWNIEQEKLFVTLGLNGQRVHPLLSGMLATATMPMRQGH